MKKILIITICLTSGIWFASCQKCSTCNEETTITGPNYFQQTNREFDACGDYLRQVDGKVTTEYPSTGYTRTTRTTCQ